MAFVDKWAVGKEKGRGKNKNVVEMSVNSVIEETRKRPRLNWGEGLAKLEKKKTKGDGVSATTIATTDSGAFSSFTGSLLDSINYSFLWPFD